MLTLDEERATANPVADGCQVTVSDAGDDQVITMSLTDLCANYAVNKTKLQELVEGWRDIVPSASGAFKVDVVKASIVFALNSLAAHEKGYDKIDVYDHPLSVTTTKKIAKHKLVLVPATRLIAVQVATADVHDSWIDLGVLLAPPEVKEELRFLLKPSTQADTTKPSPWVAPYWYLGKAGGDHDANMVAKEETVNIVVEEFKAAKNTVTIPCAWNPAPLAAGVQLFLEGGDDDADAEPEAKRAKTS